MNTHKLVPVEPTHDMVDAGAEVWQGRADLIYKAMLAAAPEVEQEPEAWIINHPDRGTSDPVFHKNIAERYETDKPGNTTPLYLHPHPVPDIDALVAAMEKLLDVAITTGKMTDLNYWSMRSAIQDADTALCNYRKQGGEA